MYFHLSAYQRFLAERFCKVEPLQGFLLQALAGIQQPLLVQEVPMYKSYSLTQGPGALSEKQQLPPLTSSGSKGVLAHLFQV